MKKSVKVIILFLMVVGIFSGCGKDNLNVRVGNNLSSKYDVIESDKLDINKSMYYSVNGKVSKSNKLKIEIENIKDNNIIIKDEIKIDNKEIDTIPVLFKTKENGKYNIIVKNDKEKLICKKEFIVEGNITGNIKKKQNIRKSESKEVKTYDDVIEKIQTAKKTRLQESIDIAKKSLDGIKDENKKSKLTKELEQIKNPVKMTKTIKGQYKVILGMDVVEIDLDFSKDCKVFVDYKEVKVYKTAKNKMRFPANKNSKIFIVKDNNVFNVIF